MQPPTIKLSNDYAIPQLGLGLWKVKDEEDFNIAFRAAIKTGYRHFDTAQMYGNEQLLGQAWTKARLERRDIFITTKINITHFAPHKLHESFEESLKKLKTDYVDLLLLHFPVPLLRKKAWQTLEDIYTSGLAKSIGVSNYKIEHLKEMRTYTKQMPHVNQVELHVFLQQPKLIKYCLSHNIQVEAYSPLGHAKQMDNEAIAEVATKHNKTYAQVMLRFLVQQGLIVIPKSINPKRLQENFEVFDFELDEADLKKLKAQDQNKHFTWSPTHIP